ncbi:binding-protein-dependent transport systems inner membrane component [Beutenbergia cavernae DSM 12333]|uniref:Binding-protein-dependent transport systems inner membrane component n=1 Tax=Beutenbergia cavernae (strain ATCC BAA-8 / DSM 12333 / CCUG 43141 / JCM 11478 / NBRC 16432 / NCIMB 13614 / HKI 0122) TaxID=471853 RepID=C5C219_BEUC1|nr:ABC transporter permease [Beutenbergia cavernae]ACQ81644.1 binding-protein-dependent transport systems inner membrane component [Beutenbergia cavernae DSM 12333]
MTANLTTEVQPPPPEDEARVDVAFADAGRHSWVPGWAVILWRNKKCRVGLLMVLAFCLVALFAPVIAPYGPREATGDISADPSGTYWLGTTNRGEDIFSQLVYGARTSLLVGIVAGAISTVISLAVGLTAGYRQGLVDEVLSFATNLALVVPVLPLIVMLAAYSPVRGLWLIIGVISITGWAYGARIKRSQVITLRTRDYVTAARLAGDSTARIIWREILPNMTSLVVVGFMGAALGAIGGEAGLAFLGLGDPRTTSWGTMLNQANVGGALITGQWAWLGAPGLALALLICSFTLINFGVDALSNPHLRED